MTEQEKVVTVNKITKSDFMLQIIRTRNAYCANIDKLTQGILDLQQVLLENKLGLQKLLSAVESSEEAEGQGLMVDYYISSNGEMFTEIKKKGVFGFMGRRQDDH